MKATNYAKENFKPVNITLETIEEYFLFCCLINVSRNELDNKVEQFDKDTTFTKYSLNDYNYENIHNEMFNEIYCEDKMDFKFI